MLKTCTLNSDGPRKMSEFPNVALQTYKLDDPRCTIIMLFLYIYKRKKTADQKSM